MRRSPERPAVCFELADLGVQYYLSTMFSIGCTVSNQGSRIIDECHMIDKGLREGIFMRTRSDVPRGKLQCQESLVLGRMSKMTLES
jgi:hypothetical protein